MGIELFQKLPQIHPTPLPRFCNQSVCFSLRCLPTQSKLWLNRHVKTAVARIKALTRLRPRLAIVLGSGFSHVADELDVESRTPYSKLPGFPKPTVAGHEGEMLVGRLSGTPVILLGGRAHFYEGQSMDEITYAVRTLSACGISDLLLTNAAGGINRKFCTGEFMLVSDHINFMGVNPLRGGSAKNLPRFVDMTLAYDIELSAMITSAARAEKIKLQRGVYLAVSGPSYETPAEIRAFARLGADAVGMSTVPEVIVARQCGLRVTAISCITNLAAGLGGGTVSHEEVLETGRRVRKIGARLLKRFAEIYGAKKK
ncbi:MAG: purine-nucleoside phosphorylase [Verrucomicrobia bacterium]|nr:purine-nucleoside phosphorylase [Verrucomicrobiota bacterium]